MSVRDVAKFEKKINESKFDDNNVLRIDSQNLLLKEIEKRLSGQEGQVQSDTVEEVCKMMNTDTKQLKATISAIKTSKALKDGTL